jgi:rhodanese-related sulfurtransferase
MEGAKFETWLGSIIKPGEKFYLAGSNEEQLNKLIERTAAIAYEGFIEEAFVLEYGEEKMDILDKEKFKKQTAGYTIVDVRNPSEIKEKKIFNNSITIPLPNLVESIDKIPVDKPIVVHCAGGYRSAAASSLIKSATKNKVPVYDLGETIKEFS